MNRIIYFLLQKVLALELSFQNSSFKENTVT